MKVGIKSSLKLKNKTTIVYTASSIVAVLVMGAFAFFYFNLGGNYSALAAEGDVITSIGSGNWSSPTVWDLNRRPENGDRVIIKDDDKIEVLNTTTNFNGEIIINGELRVENAHLRMDSNSKIAVNEGGEITLSDPIWFFQTGYITIGSTLGWFGWTGGTIIENPQVGPMAFGSGANELLPIELLSFNATLTADQDTDITWVTASEENNDYFTIERSLDGKNYFTLDTIDGAGNSTEKLEYNYVDDAPVAGYNYYRLKQTDFDGKSETFEIASVFNANAAPELNIISLGPNPYRDYFEINFTSIDESPVHLKISDMNGRTIFQKSLEAQKGNNSFTYNDRKNLQPGIYLFTIVQKGTPAKTFRLVKDS